MTARDDTAVPDPREGECLLCYVDRAVADEGCDHTLRWTACFRDVRVPGATGLERRLVSLGGRCDCEVFTNGYRLVRELCERDVDTDELREPEVAPPCAGVRHTSARPCANWVRHGRWDLVTW